MLKFVKIGMMSFILLIGVSGCLFYNNPRVSYYDINSNQCEVINLDTELNYQQFRNITPVGVNFLFSNNQGQMEIDRANSWIQNPELMVQRRFLNSLQFNQNLKNESKNPAIDAYITIFDFDMNTSTQESRVGIGVKLKIYRNNKGYDFEKQYQEIVKAEKNSPEEYAKSLSIALDKIIKQLVEDIKKEVTKK